MSPLAHLYAQHVRSGEQGVRSVFVGLVSRDPALAMTWAHNQPDHFKPREMVEDVLLACRPWEGESLSETSCRLSRWGHEFEGNSVVQLQDAWLDALDQEGWVPPTLTWDDPLLRAPVTGSLMAWAVTMGHAPLAQALMARSTPSLWQEVVQLPDGRQANLAGLAVRARQWSVLATMAAQPALLPQDVPAKAWLHVTPRAGQAMEQIKTWLDLLGQAPGTQDELEWGLKQASGLSSWRADRVWTRNWTTALGARLVNRTAGPDEPLSPLEHEWIDLCLVHRGQATVSAASTASRMMARAIHDLPLSHRVAAWKERSASHLIEPGRWTSQAAFLVAIHHQCLKGRTPSSNERQMLCLNELADSHYQSHLNQPIERGRVCGAPATLTLRGLLRLMSFDLSSASGWQPSSPQEWEETLQALLLLNHHTPTVPMRREATARVWSLFAPCDHRIAPKRELHEVLGADRLLMYTAALLRSGCAPSHEQALPLLETWLAQAGTTVPPEWRGLSLVQVIATHFERLADRQTAWPKVWALDNHKDKFFDLLSHLNRLGAHFDAARLEKAARWSSRPLATQAWLRNMLAPSGEHLPRRARLRS